MSDPVADRLLDLLEAHPDEQPCLHAIAERLDVDLESLAISLNHGFRKGYWRLVIDQDAVTSEIPPMTTEQAQHVERLLRQHREKTDAMTRFIGRKEILELGAAAKDGNLYAAFACVCLLLLSPLLAAGVLLYVLLAPPLRALGYAFGAALVWFFEERQP